MEDLLKDFIEELSSEKINGNAFNQYSRDFSANSIRRRNLFLYLKQMLTIKPRILLVGEAPSYQGCRLTGVPFGSEFIILNGIEEIGLFGESKGYQKTDELEKVRKEPSATIVWGELKNYRPIPLIWNAFPFHPHKVGNAFSNRTPNSGELKIGERFIKMLLGIFEIEKVVALGNKADKTLSNMGIINSKVRHPAQGGKAQFVAGLSLLLQDYRQ